MSPWWFVHTLPAERLHEEPRSQAHAGSLSHPLTSPTAPPRHAWAERPPSKRRPARLQEHSDPSAWKPFHSKRGDSGSPLGHKKAFT